MDVQADSPASYICRWGETEKEQIRSIDRIVLAVAGVMVLVSVLLTQYHHPNWMWLTVFVGANLLQSAFTRWCPLVSILKAVGTKPGQAF